MTTARLHGLVISQSARKSLGDQRQLVERLSQVAFAIQTHHESGERFSRIVRFREGTWTDPEIDTSFSVGPRLPDIRALLPTISGHFERGSSATALFAVERTDDAIRVHDYIAATRVPVGVPMPTLRELRALVIPRADTHRPDVNLFVVLSGAEPELGFARARTVGGRPVDPAIRAIAPLGPGWAGAQTALGTWRQGSPMIVASVANEQGTAVLGFLLITASGQIAAKAETRVARQVALGPGAVAIDGEGHVDATFVSRDTSGDGALHVIAAASDLLFDSVEITTVSPSLNIGSTVHEIQLEYGHADNPRSAATLIRTSGGASFFHTAEIGLRPNGFCLADSEEVALLGIGRHWYLIINDGATLHRETLVRVDPSPRNGGNDAGPSAAP